MRIKNSFLLILIFHSCFLSALDLGGDIKTLENEFANTSSETAYLKGRRKYDEETHLAKNFYGLTVMYKIPKLELKRIGLDHMKDVLQKPLLHLQL